MVTAKDKQYEKDKDLFFRWFMGIGVTGLLAINGFHMKMTMQLKEEQATTRTEQAVTKSEIESIKEKNRDQDKQLVELWSNKCMKPEEIKFKNYGSN